jgi:hypothetical protein
MLERKTFLMHYIDASPGSLSSSPSSPPAPSSWAAATVDPDDERRPFLGPRVVVHLGETAEVGLQWARREPLTHVRCLRGGGLLPTLAEVLAYLDGHPYVRPTDCAIRGPRADDPRRHALTLPVAALREWVAAEQRT